MKPFVFTLLVIASTLLQACNAPQSPAPPSPSDAYPPEREVNTAEIKYFNNSAIQNGIIAQHTLYPYHFVANGPEINELGQQDLNVLIDHYKTNPGKLNLRRGDTSVELYQARVQFVSNRLSQAGINVGPIVDGEPGGEGLVSEKVLTILERGFQVDYDGGSKTAQGDSGGSGSSSGNSGSSGSGSSGGGSGN